MLGKNFKPPKVALRRYVPKTYVNIYIFSYLKSQFGYMQIGFFSGRKRESIFKSPDDPFGKVGVTRSGKGLTDFQRREKHLHLKGANAENTED